MAREAIEKELFKELAAHFTTALEKMAGERPSISWDPLPSAPENASLRWHQPLRPLPGAVWVLISEEGWSTAGRMILAAAGITDADPAEFQSVYLEMTNQALAGLAQALTARLGREVSPANGQQTAEAPRGAHWAELHVKLGAAAFTLSVGFDGPLLAALAGAPDNGTNGSASGAPNPHALATGPGMAAQAAPLPVPSSKTFDLLLDVELPVSVSFGRAQIPLKDVLKLTTGSIVELNRSISEPVEIIVNNCVIARGEVVVVEGNFGVRIQEVISRQERLRTLQ